MINISKVSKPRAISFCFVGIKKFITDVNVTYQEVQKKSDINYNNLFRRVVLNIYDIPSTFAYCKHAFKNSEKKVIATNQRILSSRGELSGGRIIEKLLLSRLMNENLFELSNRFNPLKCLVKDLPELSIHGGAFLDKIRSGASFKDTKYITEVFLTKLN